MKRVGKLSARALSVAGHRKQGGRKHRRRRNERDSAKAQQKRNALGDNAGYNQPAVFDCEQTESPGEGGGQSKMQWRVGPGDARRDAREAPDDEGADDAEKAEVLEPVERRQNEIRLRR